MFKKYKHYYFLFLVLLMASCNTGVFYDQNNEVDPDGWEQDKTEKFTVDIQDTLTAYDFYLNLRHTTDYKYSNIYFFITTEFPDGRMARDTIECMLADNKGKWYGKGSGKIKDNRILVRRNVLFGFPGKYTFSFEQAMRERRLKGVTDIGIRFEESDH